MDQNSIIKGCQKGQEKAFKALVDQYAPVLMSVCKRYLKDQDLAKDALQESLISIFKSIQSYAGLGSFEGWIKKITVRVCLKEIKKNRPMHELIVVDHQESNAQEIEGFLEFNDLLALINELPEMHRIVFNLNVIEGYSHVEISEMINITESSSRVYLMRARKWLKERIEHSEKSENLILKYKS